MDVIYLIFFFILGTFLGSFYCVIGERLPKKENFTSTRSRCTSCKHILGHKDLIPVLSYLLSKGKCRYCKSKIPITLPLLEILTGLLFAVSYYSFNISYDLLIALGVVSLLIIILVTDLTYFIIPDEILIFFSIYFIIVQFLKSGFSATVTHILVGLFLFGIMYLIMCLGDFIFKKESLGGGDVKMLFLFGLVLEPLLGVMTIFIGSIIALPVAMFLLYKNKEHIIPFGPFLLIAFAILFFSKITTTDIINFLTTL